MVTVEKRKTGACGYRFRSEVCFMDDSDAHIVEL
jgi:hypothetical protein